MQQNETQISFCCIIKDKKKNDLNQIINYIMLYIIVA